MRYCKYLISLNYNYNQQIFYVQEILINCTEIQKLLPENTNISVNTRNKIPFYITHTDPSYIKNQTINRMCVLGNKLIEKNKVLKNFDINMNNAYNLTLRSHTGCVAPIPFIKIYGNFI